MYILAGVIEVKLDYKFLVFNTATYSIDTLSFAPNFISINRNLTLSYSNLSTVLNTFPIYDENYNALRNKGSVVLCGTPSNEFFVFDTDLTIKRVSLVQLKLVPCIIKTSNALNYTDIIVIAPEDVKPLSDFYLKVQRIIARGKLFGYTTMDLLLKICDSIDKTKPIPYFNLDCDGSFDDILEQHTLVNTEDNRSYRSVTAYTRPTIVLKTFDSAIEILFVPYALEIGSSAVVSSALLLLVLPENCPVAISRYALKTYNLRYIRIPSNVYFVDKLAFVNAQNLKLIYCDSAANNKSEIYAAADEASKHVGNTVKVIEY